MFNRRLISVWDITWLSEKQSELIARSRDLELVTSELERLQIQIMMMTSSTTLCACDPCNCIVDQLSGIQQVGKLFCTILRWFPCLQWFMLHWWQLLLRLIQQVILWSLHKRRDCHGGVGAAPEKGAKHGNWRDSHCSPNQCCLPPKDSHAHH